ncbi:MAG: EH signature domain-containing protein [Nitrospiraceae bacterium]|nr:EH signature domain-containing protein [Nitrospiraceae bacterium]MDA8222307.1 EH signature domain-containing protein [Desulfitobacterium hafniense]
MKPDLSTVSFNDVFKKLRFSSVNIKKSTESKPIAEIISPLQIICSSIGSSKPYKPLYVPEEYEKQWKDYLSHGRKLESRAQRYLCWEPNVASDKRFLEYLQQEQINLSARSLQGIVRACHLSWEDVSKESLSKKGSLLEMVRDMIVNYNGPNRILQKWNSSIDIVLSSNGPGLFASEMIRNFKTIKEHTESWAVEQSKNISEPAEFFLGAMMQAVQQCRHDINKCRYLFDELLHWQLWGNTRFKKMIGDLILDTFFNNESAREILQRFVLRDNRLGDPRRNKRNWADIDADAKDRFIQWLSREDIGFFFEHVLPDRKDPHERKSFWLKYVAKLKASRPLLCFEDEAKLRTQLRDEAKVGHFGKIRGANSAFILDFGQVKAVEFSRVGACYIYTEDKFNQIVPDFWSNRTFTEAGLKDKNRCVDSIRHFITYNVDWRRNVMNILARHGVRL